MGAFGVVLCSVAQNIDQSLCCKCAFVSGAAAQQLNGHRIAHGRPSVFNRRVGSRRREYRCSQFFRRIYFCGDPVWQTNAELRFQTREQFHALQTAQPQFTVQS